MRARYIISMAVIASLLALGFGALTGLSIYDLGDAIDVDSTPTLTIPASIAIAPSDYYRLKVSGGNGDLSFQENSDAISIDSEGRVSGTAGAPPGRYSAVLIVIDEDGDYDFKKVVVEIEQ